MKSTLDFDSFQVLSFDCYGTLVDWENGITNALRTVLDARGIRLSDAEILKYYSEIEPTVQQADFVNYKEVLRRIVIAIGNRLEFVPDEPESNCLVDSIGEWRTFPDTVSALRSLKSKYKLMIISNIDDDLFAMSNKRLQVEFDWIVTSQQVGGYKPNVQNFEYAFEKAGLPREKFLHVAESLYHDVAPANMLGIKSVWVNRRAGHDESGATAQVQANPDLVVPDLKSLVSEIGLSDIRTP